MRRALITMLGCLCAASLCSCGEIIDSWYSALVSWDDSMKRERISFESISDWVMEHGWRECRLIPFENPALHGGTLFDDPNNLIITILRSSTREDITDSFGGYPDSEDGVFLRLECGKGEMRVYPGDYLQCGKGETDDLTITPPWYYKLDGGTYQKCLETAYSLCLEANQASDYAS